MKTELDPHCHPFCTHRYVSFKKRIVSTRLLVLTNYLYVLVPYMDEQYCRVHFTELQQLYDPDKTINKENRGNWEINSCKSFSI